jgi:GDP-mannose 6-dehydrogenase
VAIRSTLLPGTTREAIVPRLEAVSSKRCGEDFQVCYNPEFLREGRSIRDFYEAPFTVVGESGEHSGERVVELYSSLEAPLKRCSLEVAEAIKYASNAYHAVKVAFANELAVILKELNVDGRPVMDLFCQDSKLNISPAYLCPGYGFGGSCLPKDLRALIHAARQRDVETPLLTNVLESNQRHLERAVRLVLDAGEREVALLGLSFKNGTDDLRESPLVFLAERLIGKGCRLRIFDPTVTLAKLTGANRHYIEKEIPQIGDLLTSDLDHALRGMRLAVVGNGQPCDMEKLARWAKDGTLIDLQGVPAEVARAARHYHGIAW